MKQASFRTLRTLTLGALTTIVGLHGCAEERDPINQVQPNYLPKSFFVGENLADPSDDPEFWTRSFLVDVGYGASQDGLFTSSWAQGEVARIKWVIQEDLLVGRLTYERLDGSDGRGVGAASTDGQVVVAYPIQSHFDIRRAYNPSTGEELNVYTENGSDRAWYDREFIRVDWSRNLNTDSYDFDTLSLIGAYGGVKYESLAYYVNDPDHEDAPKFDVNAGYFDITNKAFAVPGMVDLRHFGWGIDYFPSCMLDADFSGGTAPAGNCNPVELTLRQSFYRVQDTDYEPAEWDGLKFQAYGAFYLERKGYARNYGMSDDKWHRFISRYNIWQESHADVECYTPETTPYGNDANRDDNDDGIVDECKEVGAGSRCDTFSQKCTLPYADREVRPQVWYVTKGSNPNFYDGTEWATHEWDVAFRHAVVSARYAECMSNGGTDCAKTYPVHTGQQTENDDAIALAREVDDCRNQIGAYKGKSEAQCIALASSIAKTRGYSAAVVHLAEQPEMIVLCHSPVEAGDNVLCGQGETRLPEGISAADCHAEWKNKKQSREYNSDTVASCDAAFSVRIGDLRYHTVNNIEAPQTPSSWGIYTDSHDPLTGEKISSSINVWTHVTDLWAQGQVDKIRYIKGELTTEEVTEAEYVKDYALASERSSASGALPLMSSDEVDSRQASALGMSNEKFKAARANGPTPQAKAFQKHAMQKMRSIKADVKAPSQVAAIYAARRKGLLGTDIEAELTTPAMQQLSGLDDLPAGGDAAIEMASPLRGNNPQLLRQIRLLKENALGERGACVHEAPAPMAMTGMADILEEKFAEKYGRFNRAEAVEPTERPKAAARAEAIRSYLAQRAHYAVIIHEMGHSIGMRHNFVSSSDPLNYRAQYWQLRTKNGELSEPCTEVTADGEGCIGPRYFDATSKEERDNLIWMFGQSSVMDYAGEITQDLIGLGAYDFAAARMFYGESVAVFADEKFRGEEPRGAAMLDKLDGFGGITGIQYNDENGDITHYTNLQKVHGLIDKCKTVDPEAFKPANYNAEWGGTWHPLLDGLLVNVDGTYSRCEQPAVDYVQWDRLTSDDDAGAETDYLNRYHSRDANDRVRVPYGFATDSWADAGNLSVFRHDSGADAYELFTFLITSQEVDHIFSSYRRGNQGFSVRGAAYRNLSRYNEKMRDAAKGLGLYRNIYEQWAIEAGQDPATIWDEVAAAGFVREVLLASGMGFDHFTRQMARPEPGPHYFPYKNGPGFDKPADPTREVLESAIDVIYDVSPARIEVMLPNGASGYYGDIGIGAKPMGNALAGADKGEFSRDYNINVGAYYDKAFVTMLMTESADNFISDSRADFVDARYRAVSLADLFKDGYRRWLGTNLTNDDYMKGARVTRATDSKPEIEPKNKFAKNPMGWTTWWKESGPEVCFPADGTMVCSRYGESGNPFDAKAPDTLTVSPQVGWEQQKFLIAWTLTYILENDKQHWLDMMRLWEVGADSDPDFTNRIEFHDPNGKVYVAKTSGTETLFGKVVQKGVAARVLEYANELMAAAYETTPVTENGVTWYQPVLDGSGGAVLKGGHAECAQSRACVIFSRYTQIPFFLRKVSHQAAQREDGVGLKGIY